MKLSAKLNQRNRLLQQAFRISVSEWEQILKHQNGRCFICNKLPGKTRFHTDHDHKTGLIRGLLCSQCNRALGKAQDPRWQWTPMCFYRAFLYLICSPATIALGRKVYGFPGKIGTERYHNWLKANPIK